MPQLWIVAGPNGAGKTTLVSRRLDLRIAVVNPDTIAQEIPRADGRLDERRAGKIAIERRINLLARGADFAIETTLADNSALRFLNSAKKAGYKVTLVYVGLASADLSVQRVLDRVRQGGHAVPVTALERRYRTPCPSLPRRSSWPIGATSSTTAAHGAGYWSSVFRAELDMSPRTFTNGPMAALQTCSIGTAKIQTERFPSICSGTDHSLSLGDVKTAGVG